MSNLLDKMAIALTVITGGIIAVSLLAVSVFRGDWLYAFFLLQSAAVGWSLVTRPWLSLVAGLLAPVWGLWAVRVNPDGWPSALVMVATGIIYVMMWRGTIRHEANRNHLDAQMAGLAMLADHLNEEARRRREQP